MGMEITMVKNKVSSSQDFLNTFVDCSSLVFIIIQVKNINPILDIRNAAVYRLKSPFSLILKWNQ
jgi:hypothetical protein